MIKAFLGKVVDFFEGVIEANEMEEYLSQAVDHADLERRIQELQRKGIL